MRIRLSWPHGSVRIELDAGDTAAAIAAALPAEATAHRWGDEVYFRLPVPAQLDSDASDVVPPGRSAIGSRASRWRSRSDRPRSRWPTSAGW